MKKNLRQDYFWTVLFILAAVFFLLIIPFRTLSAQDYSCKGIFSLWNVDQIPQETSDIEKPFVQGASIRFSWDKIEPAQEQFQWALIDAALAKVASVNKKAILRIIAGSRSPQWVYQLCGHLTINEEELSKKLSPRKLNVFKTFEGKIIPVPWDDGYLRLWQEFISKFGKTYNSDKRIILIQMSGGGFAGEMFLGKELDWEKHGYNPQKIVVMWKRIIDFYVESFPDKPLALDIGAPIKTDYQVMDDVIDYCLTKYPGKVFIQHNGLEGSRQNNDYDNAIVSASSKTIVGYQMSGSRDWFPERIGNYRDAFEKALTNKASYFEIYRSDILGDELKDELMWLDTVL
jgi:hypothetical protein